MDDADKAQDHIERESPAMTAGVTAVAVNSGSMSDGRWPAVGDRRDPDGRRVAAVAVTDAYRQGLDPQALAGHTSRAMTERYIREKMGVVVTPPALSKKVSNLTPNR